MKTITKAEVYNASPHQVFKCIDDLGIIGMHMTKSSSMMMGGKLDLVYLTENHTGVGSRYKWKGKMMGMYMDFTVEVTKWVPGIEKIWETIGSARLIIYSWYKMKLVITAIPGGVTQAELSITYERPGLLFYKILSVLFADWYCKWCLKKMLAEAKNNLELNKIKSISKHSFYEIN
ncbi:SRPBCC family protein [Ferruginibacter profundus]